MSAPTLTIYTERLKNNVAALAKEAAKFGVELTGVTKVVCGQPEAAEAMLAAGVKAIGESRLENIERMRDEGISAPFLLLRIPEISRAVDVVRLADISLNSELSTIRELAKEAVVQKKIHDVVLMVDLGDLREGVWPEDALVTAREIHSLDGVNLKGVGTNLTCFGGVMPSAKNLGQLVAIAEEIEKALGITLDIISGGNSSSIPMLLEGKLPKRVNHLRLGEVLLLGRETLLGNIVPGLRDDVCTISAEVIELKRKPSVPIGEIGMDAFGNTPTFEDRGEILRGILNIGRQDVVVEGLSPIQKNIEIIGASSDHLLMDLSTMENTIQVGSRIEYLPSYGALLAASTSQYVKKLIK